ncbi:MAG: terminase [Clostridia bacterium]|nr:terminase [Clostridia bacterium]
MASLSANRVLSGSFAEVWVDGSRIAEANAIQLTVKMLRSDVQIGMDVDSKITGWRGEGQLRLRQVFSRFFDVVEGAAEGRDVRVTITTALKDPDSMNGEEERYSVDNVALDSLPLVNYATGKVNEQVIAFRFLPGDLKQLSGISVTEVA